jgi:hypothetical protein
VPKRVIDFDAMWGSDKLASCAHWAQAEYAWLYGLADACGCFEITNLRVIWGRVAAIRGNLTLERLEQVFDEFQDKGLLFVWECDGKRYAHWTGSDVPGRLPAPSWRMRLERFAPPVPKKQLEEYMARFARGRAARAGGGFRAEVSRDVSGEAESGRLAFPEAEGRRGMDAEAPRDRMLRGQGSRDWPARDRPSRDRVELERRADNGAGGHNAGPTGDLEGSVNPGLEETQGQDLNWGLNLNGNLNGDLKRDLEVGREPRRGGVIRAGGHREAEVHFSDLDGRANSNSTTSSVSNSNSNSRSTANSKAKPPVEETADAELTADGEAPDSPGETDLEAPFDPRGQQDLRCNLAEQTQRWRERLGVGMRGAPPRFGWSEKELAVAREIWVGLGPVCTPRAARTKPEEEGKSLASGAGGAGGNT